jgi:hypothetical protein
MATLTPGTGGTLKSTTLEAAFHEALSLAAVAEQDPLKNPQALSRIVMGLNVRTGQVTGTFTFEVVPTTGSDGSTAFPVTEYLQNTGYAKGTGGGLSSAGLCGAIVELAEKIQAKERLSSKNPQGLNGVAGLNYATETQVVSASFDYLVTGSVSTTGAYICTAKTYLLD